MKLTIIRLALIGAAVMTSPALALANKIIGNG